MIKVKGLCKGYGKQGNYAVQGVDIHVERGTIHGLIGQNGSGKTTIIKCLTGIYPSDEGEILIDGSSVYENVETKAKIGYVADNASMFGNYRVDKLADLYQKIFPEFSVEEFEQLNSIFRVNVRKRMSQLSKGQKMRVSFMLNMAKNPKVMILDEPTDGLDVMAKKELFDELVSAVENRELTVLISSHHLSELEKICDNITLIRDGKVVMEDGIEEVTGQSVKYQVIFPKGAPAGLYQRKDIYHISNIGSVYTIVLPNSVKNFREEMLAIGAIEVEELPIGLEESFVYINQKLGGEKYE